MTRKQFVKLAMASGFTRNEANSLAKRIVATGSYRTLYNACAPQFEWKRFTMAARKGASKLERTMKMLFANLGIMGEQDGR